jgi:SAM-dependent methyltransferase
VGTPVVDLILGALGVAIAPAMRRSRVVRGAYRKLHGGANADQEIYGCSYFGEGRDPTDRMGLSGYERYDRDTSNADVAAYLVWRFLEPQRVLDVGCAMGFVVEALRDVGIDAEGVDVSPYAVDHPADGAGGHLLWGDVVRRLPVRSARFDAVTVLETLEHLPPASVLRAAAELRRVCRGYVLATIPSFGSNDFGPGGWLQHKVAHELVQRYESLIGYDGPIPRADLLRDAQGRPNEGHLTIASFRWWTHQFERVGFIRCGDIEERMHPQLARFGLTKYWNLYVFRVPDARPLREHVRTSQECEAVERRLSLNRRVADGVDVAAVEEVLGGD